MVVTGGKTTKQEMQVVIVESNARTPESFLQCRCWIRIEIDEILEMPYDGQESHPTMERVYLKSGLKCETSGSLQSQ